MAPLRFPSPTVAEPLLPNSGAGHQPVLGRLGKVGNHYETRKMMTLVYFLATLRDHGGTDHHDEGSYDSDMDSLSKSWTTKAKT